MSSSPKNRILVCAFDESFALPAAVALRSVSLHWSRREPLHVKVLDSGVTDRSRSRIERSVVGSRMRIDWHPLDVGPYLDLPLRAGRAQPVYHTLGLGEGIGEDTDRVVWLDMDVLALRCLADLWDVDLAGRPLGAVQDMAVPWMSTRLDLGGFEILEQDRGRPYFNSGVMVVDMREWREEKMAERLLDYLKRNGRRAALCDQDAFNALYLEKWKALDPRWNVIAGLAVQRASRGRRHLTPELRHAVAASPWVLHFAGTFKPWRIRLDDRAARQYLQVAGEVSLPLTAPGPREKTLSVYYRYLRRMLYPLERLCWILRHRLFFF